jgi:hypothetical protein
MNQTIIIKQCNKCHISKNIEEFSKNKKTLDGLQPRCKLCHNKLNKQWRLNNPLYQKKWVKSHKKQKQNIDKQWYLNNIQRHKDTCKKWRSSNLVYDKQSKKEWRIKNKKTINQNSTQEYHNNLNHKIIHSYRNRIRLALYNNQKSGHTLELLGCTIEELKQYLEPQFTEGMSWDNYGRYGWHMDHIIPCSIFDMSDPIEQKQCFHYTNLQPLWAKDNLSKGNRLIP